MNIYIYTYAHVHIYTSTHLHTCYIYIYIYVYIQLYMCIQRETERKSGRKRVHIHMHMYTSTHLHTCYICVYIYNYICVYIQRETERKSGRKRVVQPSSKNMVGPLTLACRLLAFIDYVWRRMLLDERFTFNQTNKQQGEHVFSVWLAHLTASFL